MPVSCYIDFSVFLVDGTAHGTVTGDLELAHLPRVGERISFLFPGNGVMPLVVPDYAGVLRVEDVIHVPQRTGAPVALSLEPVVLRTAEDADLLSEFFERGYGLWADCHQA